MNNIICFVKSWYLKFWNIMNSIILLYVLWSILYTISYHYILYVYYIYLLYTYYILTIYLLYTYYILTIYLLYTYYILTLYLLYTYYILTIYLLYTYYLLTINIYIYILYILYIYTYYTLYTDIIYFILLHVLVYAYDDSSALSFEAALSLRAETLPSASGRHAVAVMAKMERDAFCGRHQLSNAGWVCYTLFSFAVKGGWLVRLPSKKWFNQKRSGVNMNSYEYYASLSSPYGRSLWNPVLILLNHFRSIYSINDPFYRIYP